MRESQSDTLFNKVRRDVFASMETGNFDRARLVLVEYAEAAKNRPGIEDRSEDLKADVIAAYGVSL